MNTVELKRIDVSNFIDCFSLKLADGQEKYVSHPIRSLAQAYVYYDQCLPFGIFVKDVMVGYVMVIYDYDEEAYNIWHMMIDKDHQGRGYGKKPCKKCWGIFLQNPLANPELFCLPAIRKTKQHTICIVVLDLQKREEWMRTKQNLA